jgi:hypothetical protein
MLLKSLPIGLALAVSLFANWASAYHVEPLMINGPDSQKKIIAIIGDGYDSFALDEYIATVNSYVMQGVFAQDETYRKDSSAFNVYRIDVTSMDYGVTVRATYEFPAGSGTIVASDASDPYFAQNTALGFIQTGDWNDCWMYPGPNTDATITSIMSSHLSRQPDIIMSVLNVLPFTTHNGVYLNKTFGGCARGPRLAVTNNVGYTVAAHEWGHSIGGLRDEYVAYQTAPPVGTTITGITNCSTVLNKNTVSWASLISTDARMTFPTVYDSSWMDSNQTVGEFEGCNYYATGVYRPAYQCRMNGNSPGFCPVCKGIWNTAITPFVDKLSNFFDVTTYLGAFCRPTSGAVTYTSNGAAANGTGSSVTLECGGRRTQSGGVFSGRVVANATVIDRNPNSNVCCSLIARDPNGTQVTGTQACSTGSGAAAQVLPLVYPKLTVSSSAAYLDVECSVPPIASGLSSSVFDYQIRQQVQNF